MRLKNFISLTNIKMKPKTITMNMQSMTTPISSLKMFAWIEKLYARIMYEVIWTVDTAMTVQ